MLLSKINAKNTYRTLFLLAISLYFLCFIPNKIYAANEDIYDEPSLVESAERMRRQGVVQFNFSNIDIVKFMRFMSELLQENIIVPPGLANKISIVSPKPILLKEAKQVMLSILTMNGFTIQDMGSYSKLIQAQGPVLIENEIRKGKEGPGIGEQNVSQIVPLTHVNVEYITQAIQQTVGQAVTITPVGSGREVMLNGRATEVNRAINVIRMLDISSNAKKNHTISINFADVVSIAAHLNEMSKTGLLPGLIATPDIGSKKVIIMAEADIVNIAKEIIAELDIDSKESEFHIYRLKHIGAKSAAEQMSQVLASSGKALAAGATAPPPSVTPDLTTNSLIFSATQKQYDSIVKILHQIDSQPKQVLLRGLIAEVNLTNLDRAGIDWSTFGGQIFGDAVIGTQMNLGGSSVPSTFMQWFQDIMQTTEEYTDANGNVKTQTKTSAMSLVYAYVELLKQFDAINVLSMPRIMCMDNQESMFQIGDVIPVLKGTTSDITNPNSVQSNYDYKPTGITLTVTPQIRSGNLVALDIVQSTEDVKASGATPTTLKREIKTSVLVKNGDTVVLGGLVREAETTIKSRVPIFSYIPLVGNLFKKTSKQYQKIDFMMFLTPYIIDSPEQIPDITNGIVLSGDKGLSEAEKAVQKRLDAIFKKHNKQN